MERAPGVLAISAGGKGLVGQTKFKSTSLSNNSAGVFGSDLSTTGIYNSGVFSVNSNSTANVGIESRGSRFGVIGYSTGIAGLEGENGIANTAILANGNGGLLFRGNNSNNRDAFMVDDSGNVHAHSFTADLAAATGQKVITYAPRASEPVIEDTGCVAQRTSSGFTVQENQGGRSSVAFAYRIVAKPLGNQGLRLPIEIEHRVPKYIPRKKSLPQIPN